MSRQVLARIEIRCPSCTVEAVTAIGRIHHYKPKMMLVSFGFWGNARFRCTHCHEQIDIVAVDDSNEITGQYTTQTIIDQNPVKEE